MEPTFPIWVFFILIPVLGVFAVEFGYRLAQLRNFPEGDEPSVSGLVQVLFALFALMLAFSFNMAQSHFQIRKNLVLQEVNNIGTVYLRAGLLDEPTKNQARNYLVDYTASRLESLNDPDRIEQSIINSENIVNQLWQLAVQIGKEDDKSITNGLFMQSLNDLIDTGAERAKARLHSHITLPIWAILFALLFLSMATMGYHTGVSGTRLYSVYIFVILAFSLVMYLVADLDQPQRGIINVSQMEMVDLHSKLSTSVQN